MAQPPARQSFFDKLTGKTELATFVAAGVIVAGTAYAIYSNDVELVKVVVYAGIGFLFGRNVASNGASAP